MATPRKAGKKPAKPRGKGVPFAKGDDPRRNVTRPGPGRPPDEFKALLASLASWDETITSLQVILADPSHPNFAKALDYVTDRGYTALEQQVTVAGPNGGAIPVEITRRVIPAPPPSE